MATVRSYCSDIAHIVDTHRCYCYWINLVRIKADIALEKRVYAPAFQLRNEELIVGMSLLSLKKQILSLVRASALSVSSTFALGEKKGLPARHLRRITATYWTGVTKDII